MRQAKSILAALSIGTLFSAIFWLLLASSLPAHAAPSAHPAGAARENPADPAPYSPTSSAAVTFGPIQVVTGPSAGPSGTNLAQDLGRALALAMDISPTDILSAALMCEGGVCTDPAGTAVLGLAPGTWYPTRGETFALLSTGTVTGLPSTADYQAVPPRQGVTEVAESPASEVLHGLANAEGGDRVRLHLALRPPLTATCLALDFTFYTVDLPYTATVPLSGTVTATGTVAPPAAPTGDIFTAQVGNPDLRLDHGTLLAPGNIAYNAQGELVTSSTMSPSAIYASLRAPGGSNIRGVFPLLQMRQVVTGGEPLDLYLSIQDRGDAYADSAVALDNFAWLPNTDPAGCQPQPGHSGDRDGDGLPDGWEQYGTYQADANGTPQRLDLPAWGADPDVKDIFVEVDAMQPLTPGGYDPRPIRDSIAQIVAAFARAPVDPIPSAGPTAGPAAGPHAPQAYKGIHLHVDYGSAAPLNMPGKDGGAPPTGGTPTEDTPTWDTAAQGSTLAQDTKENLCGSECADSLDWLWNTLDAIKHDNFPPARAAVFHYALFAHQLADCTPDMMDRSLVFCGDNTQISGISKNLLSTADGASDFVVALGAPDWTEVYTSLVVPQAGTFMHELGHNLGLNHYGTVASEDPLQIMNKPNHLSVMNYLYQTTGLVVTGTDFLFDYSRYNMAPLTETELWETQGISMAASGINITYTLGVRYHCTLQTTRVVTDAHQVNWDCDGYNTIQAEPVKRNITGDVDTCGRRKYSDLAVTDEWDQLVYTGGMLNRQRSLLPPLIAVRPPAPESAGQSNAPESTGRTNAPAAAPPVPRLLVLHEPVVIGAANQLLREELRVKQANPSPYDCPPTP